jgi:hypothetical protein
VVTSHSIIVVVNVEVYYASIDEAQTKLSEAAGELLANNDIPGFFDGCGAYYIRSINRRASFVSKYTYKTKDTKRDYSFEAKLELELKAMGVASAKIGVESSTKFAQEASSKSLTIESTALGLGKEVKASLVA